MKRKSIRSIGIALIWLNAIVLTFEAQRAAGQLLPYPSEDGQARETELPLPPATSGNTRSSGTQAFLGVTFEPSATDAAVARSVAPSSPAEQAGVRAGDVIEALNGRRVASYQDAIAVIHALHPGDSIEIEFSRRVHARSQAVLASAPAASPYVVGYPSTSASGAREAAPVSQFSEEQLPAPTLSQRRGLQRAPQYGMARVVPPQTYNMGIATPPRNSTTRARSTGDRGQENRNRGLFRRRN
jgi:membrane-associated protease RseP (regulator of RpoE activity)